MMDQTTMRAWWWQRQGLDGSLAGKPATEVLNRAGWVRSVGGANPYLTLFARAGLGRSTVDAAVAALDIHELPAARRCTYVVPSRDFALALKVGQAFGGGEMNVARKLGVTDKDVDRLCEKVVDALAKGPLDPEALKAAAGSAVKNFGEEGKKKGLASTLPVALGRLQQSGHIRRVPTDGRLDQQRYRYVLWRMNPLAAFKPTADEAYVELARRFFTWIEPARTADFQWFSGLGVKAAKAAVDPLGLVPIEAGSEWLINPEDLDAFRRAKPPARPQYALVGSIDSISLLRRDLPSLVDPADLKRSVAGERGARELGGLSDLPSHAILDRGRVVGLWEFDPEARTIAWWAFGANPKDKALVAAVERTEAFIAGDLGDARSFSLDSAKSRAPRIAALRRAAAHA
jgi:hypothetical protein